MENKLSDLNNHLFAQLERLNDEGITGDELKEEISRSHAVIRVSSQIIANGKLVLDAKKLQVEYGLGNEQSPEIFQIENKKEK